VRRHGVCWSPRHITPPHATRITRHRLAREKKQLLQLAVEEQHCSFAPHQQQQQQHGHARSSSRSG
jgi:hypothetical protein